MATTLSYLENGNKRLVGRSYQQAFTPSLYTVATGSWGTTAGPLYPAPNNSYAPQTLPSGTTTVLNPTLGAFLPAVTDASIQEDGVSCTIRVELTLNSTLAFPGYNPSNSQLRVGGGTGVLPKPRNKFPVFKCRIEDAYGAVVATGPIISQEANTFSFMDLEAELLDDGSLQIVEIGFNNTLVPSLSIGNRKALTILDLTTLLPGSAWGTANNLTHIVIWGAYLVASPSLGANRN